MANAGPMTLDQRKEQLKMGFMEAFNAAIKVKQQKEIDEAFLLSLNVNSLDDLFEKYFDEMIKDYTERAINKIPNNKLKEFGANMSRSLAGVIPKEGKPSPHFIPEALSSLKTDLYAKASFIEDYTADIGSVMGKVTTNKNSQSDFSDYIYSKIQNGYVKAAGPKKVFLQSIAGSLGFTIGRPLNTVLSDPTFASDKAKEYFRTYSNLVSGMLAQLSNSEKPFVKAQGKLNILEPIVIEAICIYASQLALDPQMQVLDDKSQQLYARDLAKMVSADNSLTQKYQKGFVQGQATVERQNEVRDDISKSLHNKNNQFRMDIIAFLIPLTKSTNISQELKGEAIQVLAKAKRNDKVFTVDDVKSLLKLCVDQKLDLKLKNDTVALMDRAGLTKKDLTSTAPEQSKRGSPLDFLRKQLQETTSNKTVTAHTVAVEKNENIDPHKKLH